MPPLFALLLPFLSALAFFACNEANGGSLGRGGAGGERDETGGTGGDAGTAGGAGSGGEAGRGGGSGAGGVAGQGGTGGGPSTERPSWGEATLIASGNHTKAQVAVNEAHQAMVVWEVTTDTPNRLGYVRFDSSAGWGAVDTLALYYRGLTPVDPRVAMHSSGTAMVTWLDSARAFSDRHTPNVGWDGPSRFDIRYLGVAKAEMAMDAEGNVVTAFEQGGNIAGNYFSTGIGWDDASYLEMAGGGTASSHVATNMAGVAQAVWIQGSGPAASIRGVWAAAFERDIGWSPPIKIEEDSEYASETPRASIDDAGNVLVAWKRADGIRSRIWINWWRSGSSWGTPVALDAPSSGDARDPRAILASDGHGVVVWLQVGPAGDDVLAATYDPETGFAATTTLGAALASTDQVAEVAMDDQGHSVVVWTNGPSVMASYFAPELGWRSPEPIGESESGRPAAPHVAMAADGFAIAVWADSMGIWSNRFEPRVSPSALSSSP